MKKEFTAKTAVAKKEMIIEAGGQGGEIYSLKIKKGKCLPVKRSFFGEEFIELIPGTCLKRVPDNFVQDFEIVEGSFDKKPMVFHLGLCEGRHEMPAEVQGFIFGSNEDPLDVEGLQERAEDALKEATELVLYVTGLTVALVSVINVCHNLGIKLTLMHYDRDLGRYYPQSVFPE